MINQVNLYDKIVIWLIIGVLQKPIQQKES